MPTPIAAGVVLTDEERACLEAWSRRRKTAQALALRSRIVLAAADGAANYEIAEHLGVSRPTVTKWRNWFAQRRLEGLLDEPRPGRPRTVTDAQAGRADRDHHVGERAQGCDALVDTVAGRASGCLPGLGVAHLAGVRVAAAPPGEIQALRRSAVHREGL